MLNYTDAVTALMRDVVKRVAPLSFIDLSRVLVFARFGRSGAAGPYATCHTLNLPVSEPRYFFWTDPRTRRVARRSEWFVTRSPDVTVEGHAVKYLISVTLPRFCDQTLFGSLKHGRYRGEPWLAKLDTIVHELYHIDPAAEGIRVVGRCDAGGARCHSPAFFEEVAEFVRLYLASGPDPSTYEFLTCDFAALQNRHGAIVATTFRQFPSYPQRYHQRLAEQPVSEQPDVTVVPLAEPQRPTYVTERDLARRAFTERGSRRWVDLDAVHVGPGVASLPPPGKGARAASFIPHRASTTRRAPTNRGGQ